MNSIVESINTLDSTVTGNYTETNQKINTLTGDVDDLRTQLASPFTYKGTVASISNLPSSNNVINDTYFVEDQNCLYSWNGTAWSQSSYDAEGYAQDLADLKSAINSIETNDYHLTRYSYKANTYINNSGVETPLAGYDTYIIPCSSGDIIRLSWDTESYPWGSSFSSNLAIKIALSDSTYIGVTSAFASNGGLWVANKEAIIIAPSNAVCVTCTVLSGNQSTVNIEINTPSSTPIQGEYLKIYNSVYTINADNAITTQFYWATTGKVSVLGNSVKAFILHVKQGDILTFAGIPSGVSMRATFRASNETVTAVGTIIASPFVYTVPSDGILSVLCSASNEGDTVRSPKNQIKIDAKNVVGLSDGTQFNGFDGVAFGTSLTYNSLTGNGYLTQLGILSGISFDNQGVGSSTILGNGGSLDMLAKIKAYTNFASKRICILEGFVNDWYGQNPLGTWKDAEETTVCGCVRSALTYMLTQNANMTVFLILDHYGKQYNTLDCSSTVKKNNLTQYEYYSEIAKVAESLGIPVIREFELSGISELMPQYLADNIHLNALGAIQSGNVIWNEMKLHPVNES